jgi:hypothetical protein
MSDCAALAIRRCLSLTSVGVRTYGGRGSGGGRTRGEGHGPFAESRHLLGILHVVPNELSILTCALIFLSFLLTHDSSFLSLVQSTPPLQLCMFCLRQHSIYCIPHQQNNFKESLSEPSSVRPCCALLQHFFLTIRRADLMPGFRKKN